MPIKEQCYSCGGTGRKLIMGIEYIYCPVCKGKGFAEAEDKPIVPTFEIKPKVVKPPINLLTHYPSGQKRRPNKPKKQ